MVYVLYDNKNLEFEIAGLRLIFEFKTDSEGQRLEKKVAEGNTLKLNVFNTTPKETEG